MSRRSYKQERFGDQASLVRNILAIEDRLAALHAVAPTPLLSVQINRLIADKEFQLVQLDMMRETELEIARQDKAA